MSASTNPFITGTATGTESANEGTHPEQHHPNNPFLRNTSTTIPPPSSSQSQQEIPFETQTHSNPFQNGPSTMGSGQPIKHESPFNAARQQDSADAITQSLSGLDFGSGATSAPERQSSAIANPFSTTYPSPGNVNTQPGNTTSPTVYAPPPGPPPEIVAAQNAANQYTNGNSVPSNDDQFAVNQVKQMETDEEYARKIWAREEERQRRREERGSGAGLNSAERQRQKQRKQSYDPTLAALGGAPAPHSSGSPGPAIAPQAPLPPSNSDLANEEKQWNTKEIYWKGRSQRIIVQNENGPCSLIALCNVLLLRGTVQITPEDRPAVSYSYLSSMLGEHLIDAISTNPGGALDLEAALSILPQTQYGLDVNVKFSAIDAFATESEKVDVPPVQESVAGASASSSSAAMLQAPSKSNKNAQRGELALFKLCNVPLVHGWLADQADAETWAAIVDRAGDYDKALDRVVAGDEIAKSAEGDASFDIRAAQVMDTITPDQRVIVQDALVIRRFLEATATQLTYPGLYALSTSLERGVLYALFRNSHLSVLYRPTEEELLQAASTSDMHSQPQLYQLVTDSTLENEDSIVWESVEDIDGSASRFFDGKFRHARVQDFVGRGSIDNPNQANEDADFAYAQQLQERERERAHRHQRAVETYRNKRVQSNNNNNTTNASGGSGNLIARMLQNRKSSKHAPSNAGLHQNVDSMLGGESSNNAAQNDYTGSSRPHPATTGPAPGEEYQQKEGKKWWKKVF